MAENHPGMPLADRPEMPASYGLHAPEAGFLP